MKLNTLGNWGKFLHLLPSRLQPLSIRGISSCSCFATSQPYTQCIASVVLWSVSHIQYIGTVVLWSVSHTQYIATVVPWSAIHLYTACPFYSEDSVLYIGKDLKFRLNSSWSCVSQHSSTFRSKVHCRVWHVSAIQRLICSLLRLQPWLHL